MANHESNHQVTATHVQHPISDTTASTKPVFDLRCGGVRVTVDRAPYRLLALISTTTAALGAGSWFVR